MAAKSWVPVAATSPFSIANIPFGIITTPKNPSPRPATIIGNKVLDLKALADRGGFSGLGLSKDQIAVFSSPTLNAFAALGRPFHRQVRLYIQDLLSEQTRNPNVLRDHEQLRNDALIDVGKVTTHLPMAIGDYTDFFAGINHAFTVGSLFRGPENALQPNYKHLPVGYHGRASSVVVSGTALHRPWGQIIADPADPKKPSFKPCRRLDIELELGAFVSIPNELGKPIPVDQAGEHIFGYVLMNDWSARDIQTWEYVPLGPFNAKNFGTTISAWVVLPDAFAPFAVEGIKNDGDVLPHLKESNTRSVYDIKLQVELTTAKGDTTTITETNGRNLIWSFNQMLAHHSSGGCNMRTGDLLGSGTISGDDPKSRGSMLEQNMAGKHKIQLNGGEERLFLQDGDTITITGLCGSVEDGLVGFGECTGRICEAIQV